MADHEGIQKNESYDPGFRLGCDIGGTFTDFVLVNDKTGEFKIFKCLTTPSDPSEAVEKGIKALEDLSPGYVPELGEIIHHIFARVG